MGQSKIQKKNQVKSAIFAVTNNLNSMIIQAEQAQPTQVTYESEKIPTDHSNVTLGEKAIDTVQLLSGEEEKAKANSKKQKIASVFNENTEVNSQLKKLEQEFDKIKQEKEELTAELSHLRDDLTAKQNELKQKQQELIKASAEIENIKNEHEASRESHKAQLAEKEKKTKELEAQLENTLAIVTTKDEKIKSLGDEHLLTIKRLESELLEARTGLAELNQQVTANLIIPTSPTLEHDKLYTVSEVANSLYMATFFSANTVFFDFLKHVLSVINSPCGQLLTFPISAGIQIAKFVACSWDYYDTSKKERTSAKKVEFGVQGVSTGLVITAAILSSPLLAMAAVVTTYVVPALFAASLVATIVSDVKNLLSYRRAYLDEQDPIKKQEYRDTYHKEITKTIVKGVIKLGTAAGIMVMLAFHMSVIATAATLAISAITNQAVIFGSGKLHEKISAVSPTTFFKNQFSCNSSRKYDKLSSSSMQQPEPTLP